MGGFLPRAVYQGIVPNDTYPKGAFPKADFSQGGLFPRVLFPKVIFPKGDFSQGGLFPRVLFPKGTFPKDTFSKVTLLIANCKDDNNLYCHHIVYLKIVSFLVHNLQTYKNSLFIEILIKNVAKVCKDKMRKRCPYERK